MREKRFIVKPDEKVVVAVMNVPDCGVTDEVTMKCTKPTMYAVLNMIMDACDLDIPDLEIPFHASYKGVSKCDEHDTFDEIKGKKIAGEKADMKYHASMMKKYKRLSDLFKKASDEMQVLEFEHMRKHMHIKESLQKNYFSDLIKD